MGLYLNPRNDSFQQAINNPIYVDKSLLIKYTNQLIGTGDNKLCVSRPRRFGKSTDANMLVAYYSKGCDSHHIFNYSKSAKQILPRTSESTSCHSRQYAGFFKQYTRY